MGTPESIVFQQQVAEAFLQHVIEPLRERGYEEKVFITSYSSGYENLLKALYPYAVDIHIGQLYPFQFKPVILSLTHYTAAYPEIAKWLIVRRDMCFKEAFTPKLLDALSNSSRQDKILAFFQTHPWFGDKSTLGRDIVI